MNWLGKKLELKKFDDWYSVTQEDLQKYGGIERFQVCDTSLSSILESSYPEHQWKPWKFNRLPHGWWNKQENQKRFLESLAKELGLKELDDYYLKIRTSDIENAKGSGFLRFYGYSIGKALMTLYPEHKWRLWRFGWVPNGFWGETKNQREFFDFAAIQLNIKTLSEWYKIPKSEIERLGGSGLLDHFGGYLFFALTSAYPEHQWKAWMFDRVPNGFWKNKENQLSYFDHLAKELNINNLEEWKKVKLSDVKNFGTEILNLYGNSISKALSSVYPHHSWDDISKQKKKDWEMIDQRNFFDKVSLDLGINKMEDWYKIQWNDIQDKGGSSILKYYRGSLIKSLSAIYPEHLWLPWKFISVPRGFWDDNNNIQMYLSWLSSELNIQEFSDWYSVSHSTLGKLGAFPLLQKSGGLITLLSKYYPNHSWDATFHSPKVKSFSKRQNNLITALKLLFPNEIIQTANG